MTNPTSAPIVLIHGFPLDDAMWLPQVQYLTAKGYRVLTPNLPGFGSPPSTPAWPKDRYSIDALADFIDDYIQQHANGNAIVGGFSMGGYILLSLLRNHRQSIRAAMLIDTRAEADTPEARATRLQSIEDIQAAQSTAPLVEAMLPRLLSQHAAPALKAHARSIMSRQSPEALIGAQFAMSRRIDQTHLLATLTLPVLLLVGAQDAITPPSVAMAMHNHMPHSMLVQIASAGHLANLEAPDSVSIAIETFLHTLQKS